MRMYDGGRKAAIGAGLGAGFALLGVIGRRVAMQAPTVFAGDWEKGLAIEHKAALALFDRLAQTEHAEKTKRTMLLSELKHALSKHALQEENLIYPAMRDAGLTEEADKLNHEHGYVKQYLYDLRELVGYNQAFQKKLAEFRADIEKHMTEEEQRLFPRLKEILGKESNSRLTRKMNMEGLKLA